MGRFNDDDGSQFQKPERKTRSYIVTFLAAFLARNYACRSRFTRCSYMWTRICFFFIQNASAAIERGAEKDLHKVIPENWNFSWRHRRSLTWTTILQHWRWNDFTHHAWSHNLEQMHLSCSHCKFQSVDIADSLYFLHWSKKWVIRTSRM